jgi:hypothetical protein
MWRSAYRLAEQGRLGIDLPKATARLVLSGPRESGKRLATHVTLMGIDANEAPFAEHPVTTTQFTLHAGQHGWSGGRKPKEHLQVRIPLNSEGTACLTDSEWEKIGALTPPHHIIGNARKLAQRELIDGVLTKLSTGLPWRTVAYPCGTYTNVSLLYRRMKADGRWERLEQFLRTARSR